MITRPFGAQVGLSSRLLRVSRRSSLPSGRITPMLNMPPLITMNAIRSPRGDQTGAAVAAVAEADPLRRAAARSIT